MKLRDRRNKMIAVQGGYGGGVSAGKLKAVAVARWGKNVLKAGISAFKKATNLVLRKMSGAAGDKNNGIQTTIYGHRKKIGRSISSISLFTR